MTVNRGKAEKEMLSKKKINLKIVASGTCGMAALVAIHNEESNQLFSSVWFSNANWYPTRSFDFGRQKEDW
jgi:hypothetical protein